MKIIYKGVLSLNMMNKIDWNTYNYDLIVDYIKNEIENLPIGISISTMCSSCKLNTPVNILNIEKYLSLDQNDILCVKLNTEKKRSLLTDQKKNKRNKEIKVNHFYNQITVIIRVTSGPPISDLNLEPKINLKLFKNGSIQMSGCKSLKSINIVLNKLLVKLKQIKAKVEDGKIVEKKFVENIDDINIHSFKVDMINSNYKVNMQIDRAKFYSLLIKKKIKSSFEPCIRACVIIKYTPIHDNLENKEISIFVFQKGNIIITGARTRNHIISAYKYINNILITHYDDINKKDDKEEETLILSLYEDVMKENF
jgi:TATA-box binding protein (TBP) (component of TFIID and TFIIIB)